MKKLIDALDNTSGWVVNAPSTVTAITFPELIAGLNSASLQFKIDALDTSRVITKPISPAIDVTEYETLVFSIWSQNYGNSSLYRKPSDFAYKITLNGVNEYFVPIFPPFQDISIGIEEVTSISEITITALHQETDYIVISEMIAEKEEMNYDILTAVKENLEFDITAALGDGVLISSGFTGTSGDVSLSFPAGVESLDRYAVIKIKEGATEEVHQIGNNEETAYTMLPLFDGISLLNTYTAADVYLQFPVIINPTEQEAHIPGVSVWGVSPEEIFPTFKLDTDFDTVISPGTFKGRLTAADYELPVLIDCEAREYELLAKISGIVRRWIGKEICWINGRKHDVEPSGPPVEIRPETGINIIPKNQYTTIIRAKEALYDRQNIPAVTDINIDVTPERS
jgi:hypothetical protein